MTHEPRPAAAAHTVCDTFRFLRFEERASRSQRRSIMTALRYASLTAKRARACTATACTGQRHV
ncbi:hypothetical protein VL15_31635 [Burkholderia cepacia]|uniref:Uncharacterized protein n=1 Tax=Burkholderia cepacia TaxID=292 RepID=A0A0J5WF52_BURCE|nr:hypothetical protein VL15_31635 [Burkholderia cepacia]